MTMVWVGFALVPLLMAFATLILPDQPNRWTNGVLGVLSAGLWVTGFVEDVSVGMHLLTASVVVVSLLVVVYAWKWPVPHPVEMLREPVRVG